MTVTVPRLGWTVRASSLELCLFEVQCRYADALGILPERVRVIAFEDVSDAPPPASGSRSVRGSGGREPPDEGA